MSESNKKHFLSCDDAEQLLIKTNIDKITSNESHLVRVHLKSCERCRRFQNALLEMQNSMQVGKGDKLVPDPAIRENLIQRMRDLKPQEAGIFSKTYKAVKSLLEYRIPVYQTLPVVALIVIIFLAVEQFPPDVRHEPEYLQSIDIIESSAPAQLRVTDNLGIVNQQKIGQSVRDDTTLTRFIVGTI